MLKSILAAILGFFGIQAFAQTLTIGSQAPDFTLTDDAGNPWQLSAQRGKVTVLYFYPSDDTPGCTKEACSLRDNYNAFAKLNIQVVGINYNSTASHQKFKAKHRLPFTLLSDPKKAVAKLYQAKRLIIPVPLRKTIIIDQQRVVRFILNDVDVTTHTDIVLTEAQKLTRIK